MGQAMTDGLANLVAQAVQAGFVAPQRNGTGTGHRLNPLKGTLDEAHVSRQRRENKRINSEIAAAGHGDTQDTCLSRDSAKHPKRAREPTPSPNVVLHLGDVPGLPTHPVTCVSCGKADWLVTLRTGDGLTFHVSCWRAASAPNHRGA